MYVPGRALIYMKDRTQNPKNKRGCQREVVNRIGTAPLKAEFARELPVKNRKPAFPGKIVLDFPAGGFYFIPAAHCALRAGVVPAVGKYLALGKMTLSLFFLSCFTACRQTAICERQGLLPLLEATGHWKAALSLSLPFLFCSKPTGGYFRAPGPAFASGNYRTLESSLISIF